MNKKIGLLSKAALFTKAAPEYTQPAPSFLLQRTHPVQNTHPLLDLLPLSGLTFCSPNHLTIFLTKLPTRSCFGLAHHGLPWPAIAGHGWLVMAGHGQQWPALVIAMAGHGQPWPVMAAVFLSCWACTKLPRLHQILRLHPATEVAH